MASYNALPSEELLNTKTSSQQSGVVGIELPLLETTSHSSSRKPGLARTTHDAPSLYDQDYHTDSEQDISSEHGNESDNDFSTAGHSSQRSKHQSDFRLLPLRAHTYHLERHVLRTILNTLGPIVVLILYSATVYVYLQHPDVNDVIPYYHVDARIIFYAWVLLSIFILDWAKSGLAGFEASALMKPKFAPISALGFMWHADRSWGSVSGWLKALTVMYKHISPFRQRNISNLHQAQGPGLLWFYLAVSSFLLYVATPLASLSMELKQVYAPSNRQVEILGPDQVGFEARSPNAVAEEAKSRWRSGAPTTPQGESIFYAPPGTRNVSSTYYEDIIQAIYYNDSSQGNISADSSQENKVVFFSGPRVSERVRGTAWGLLTELECKVANPYTGLNLLRVQSIDQWSAPQLNMTSRQYNLRPPNISLEAALENAQMNGGLIPLLFSRGRSGGFGASHAYLITVDSALSTVPPYAKISTFPTNGSLELVMWQTFETHNTPDQIFNDLPLHPAVVTSFSDMNNLTYHGYAVRCEVNSSVGFAELDAGSRTFSNFVIKPSKTSVYTNFNSIPIVLMPNLVAIQSIAYAAFTTMSLGWFGPPACDVAGVANAITCTAWYSANIASGGSYVSFQNVTNGLPSFQIQLPTISPARMKLAIYKLFGEVAVAMMGSGTGPWTGELYGMRPASALVPGIIPWQIVLYGLLCPWVIITVLPNLWTLTEKRWAGTLDGLQLFRLGAEWRDAVWKFSGSDITKCESLRNVPGMIGDMEEQSQTGFIGLSKDFAQRNKTYVFDRDKLSSN